MTSDRTGQRIDNYQLSQKLGGGSFGQVYLAEDLRRKTKVAIKVLDPFTTQKERDQFFDEVRSLVRLRHPNIVSVIDFGINKANNLPFIVMEYAPNGSLREKHHGQQLPLATVMHYVKQIASALQYAHEDQLIHRDIKPDNIFIGTSGELLLGDFGIAVLSSSGRVSLQLPQGSAGTPHYMAPEQIKGKPSRSSDQYALAIITYEWLCGKPPFTGSMIEIMGQHLNAAPQPVSEVVSTITPQVEQVVLKALAKEIKDRYSTVQAFADALEGASRTILIGTRLLTYTGHSGAVRAVAWSPDGSLIASTSDDGTVQVWDTSRGQHLLTYTGHTSWVNAVAWSPDGSRIASASGDKTAQVWDAMNGHLLLIFTDYSSRASAVAWSPDGSCIAIPFASAFWKNIVQVCNATSGQILFTYYRHSDFVNVVAWSPGGSRIVSGSEDKTVHIWNATSGQTLFKYYGHAYNIEAVVWSPDGSRVASASNDGTVQVWGSTSKRRKRHPLNYTGHSSCVLSVAWSPDGSRITSGSQDETVQVWNTSNGRQLFTYTGHSDIVNAVAWSPDGSRIASASVDGTVQVWQAV